MRVGLIGAGAMGSPIGERLLGAGFEVVAWNRTASRLEPLRLRGAKIAASPAELAGRADVVITMVRDAAALHAVAEGDDGLIAGVRAAGDRAPLVVEMSTTGPEAVRWLAGELPALIDAPVLGSIAEAASGKLIMLAGGTPEACAVAEPVLAVLGRVERVGDLGAGAAAKLVANAALINVVAALGEVLALGSVLGLDADATYGVLAHTPLAVQAARRRSAIENGSYPPRFRAELARKDAGLISAAAPGLRICQAAGQWLADTCRNGAADLDYTAVLAEISNTERAGRTRQH